MLRQAQGDNRKKIIYMEHNNEIRTALIRYTGIRLLNILKGKKKYFAVITINKKQQR